MAIDAVREYFRKIGIDDKILEFDVSSATVELAAQALNCEAKRIAKTLSFLLDGKCVLVVAAGDAKIDNSKYRKVFGKKAKMLNASEVKTFTGHEVGGVCPFAVKKGVDIFLDESLKRFGTVFPACGSNNSAIELTLEELEKYSGFRNWIDVCRDWE